MTPALPEHGISSSKPRILIFCRPYLVSDFRANVAPLDGEFEFSFLTDGRSSGTPDTREKFYLALRSRQRCQALDAADEEDVRQRCRLLRNIDRDQAISLMHAMASVISASLDQIRPKAVLSHLVDEYVTHLISLLAGRRGIRFVNYFASYFPGRVQLTQQSRGTAYDVCEPTDAEVDAALEAVLRPTFRQNYRQRNSYTKAQHLRSLARYQVKRVVFSTKAWFERDPWNLHYAVTPYIAERRYFRDFPTQADFHADWRTRLQGITKQRKGPIIYVPLAYFPEATTDYWVSNRRILKYDHCLMELLQELAGRGDGIVVVKEHLHMMGARDSALYRKILGVPNVISVHPTEYSNNVLEACDAVVIGSGSVGIEATVRGKPVFSYCDSSYWFRPAGAFGLDLDAMTSWGDMIRTGLLAHRPKSPSENHVFIRECLKSNVRMRGHGRIWPFVEVDDLRSALQAA